MLLFAWSTIVSLQSVSSLPEVIKLAGLFDTNSASQEASFLRAVDAVNDDRTILTKSLVSADVGRYPADDSFKASKKLCEIIQPGVSALFGPTTKAASNNIQALSDTLNVPFLQTKFDYIFKKAAFSINVHPHPSQLGKAYADFVKQANWKSLIVLYESEEGLVKLQELLKLPNTFQGLQITLKQLIPASPALPPDYRPLLKEIKKSQERRIVLDVDYDKIALILDQAHELDLLTAYHNYLVTSLDVDKINLDKYVHHNVNITGFRLIDPESRSVHEYLKDFPNSGEGKENYLFSENAFVHDAVRVYAKALNDLDSLQDMEITPLSCEAGAAWDDGEKVLGYIKEVEYVGLTGEIKFDSEGFRTKFPLDLMEKVHNRLKKTAVWTEAGGVNYTLTATEMIGQTVTKLQNTTLRITTTTNDPYVMKKIFDPAKEPEALKRMSFEEKYEGFCVDLIKELAKEVQFKYTFYLVEGGGYGSFKNGRWTGMIADLRSQKADLAVIDMSITAIRQSAVDFTMPYMSTGVGILYKKKKPPPPNPFSFLQPLSIEVWIYTTTAYLGVSITLFLLARISPYEWDDDGEGSATNQWTISNALWFGIGSFLCQGCDILPKSISTRTVAIMWWFFTLIMMSSYTANLAAFLTASKMSSPVNSAEDLAKQTKIKYGTYCCGSTNSFFSGSTIPTYQKINAFMESAKPSVYTSGNSAGIERVRKEDGLYAFFMEAAAIEYHIERKCDLKQLGGLLDSKGYGIALPKDSPYTQAISQGVIRLIEKGVVTDLKEKWWEKERGGGACKEAPGAGGDQMKVAALAGLFMMLIVGMLLAAIIAVCEFTWRKRKLAVDENTSVVQEMWEELKFAINPFAGDTKANPMKCDSQTASRASSKAMLSKSTAESLHNPYGQIGDELSHTKGRKDSVYAVFNDQS